MRAQERVPITPERVDRGRLSQRRVPGARDSVLSLQRTIGNSAMQLIVQRHSDGPQAFAGLVAAAEAALKVPDRTAAVAAYQRAALPVALSIGPPTGLALPRPALSDIAIDLGLDDYGVADARHVPMQPANPWRWIALGRRAFSAPETVGVVLTHELVHARQYQRAWVALESMTSAPKPSWTDWIRHQAGSFAKGPAELEAEVEVIGRIPRLPPADRSEQLQRLFVSLFLTVEYRPTPGAAPAVSPPQASKAIVGLYGGASPELKTTMGSRLYRAILEVEEAVSREHMVATLQLIRPIAVDGFRNMPEAMHATFLAIPGVRDAVAGGSAR